MPSAACNTMVEGGRGLECCGWVGVGYQRCRKKEKKTRVIITKGIVGFKRLASLVAIPPRIKQAVGWHLSESFSSPSLVTFSACSPLSVSRVAFAPSFLFFVSFFIFSFSHLSFPQQGPLISPPSSKTSSPPDTADRQIIKHNRFCLEFVSRAVILAPHPTPSFSKIINNTGSHCATLNIYLKAIHCFAWILWQPQSPVRHHGERSVWKR